MDETIATRLARRVVGIDFAGLPADVVERAKQSVLDQLGVQTRGSTLAHVQPALRLALSAQAWPESTIVGNGARSAAPYAAYVNGTFGHSFEFDDGHILCGHPGVCVIPAVLAVAERIGASGRDVITAIVAGYESAVLGTAPVHQRMLELGWQTIKVTGGIGAAGAISKLLGLTVEQTANAFAIAANDASGVMEYDQSGGESKRLAAGSAARSGVEAALLAQDGMTGPPTIFEGRRGIYKIFAHLEAPDIEPFWTPDRKIMGTMFKFYPNLGTNHAPLDALREMIEQYDFGYEDVAEITVYVAGWTLVKVATIRRPKDLIGAQTSLPFNLGLWLVHGRAAIEDFVDPDVWNDPRILGVADKVSVLERTFAPDEPTLGATLVVVLDDGRRFEKKQTAWRGHPLSEREAYVRDDLREKFRGVTRGLVSEDVAEEVIDLTDRLDELADPSRMTRLLCTG